MAALPDISPRIAVFNPAFEVKETKDGYIFKADVPGVLERDLEITLQANRLTITGKRESEETKKDDTFYAYERTFGSFTRTFTLPEGADAEHVKAELKEGVLTLQIPKTEEAQPKKIAFKVEKGKA
jgi:HSP20 family protein